MLTIDQLNEALDMRDELMRSIRTPGNAYGSIGNEAATKAAEKLIRRRLVDPAALVAPDESDEVDLS